MWIMGHPNKTDELNLMSGDVEFGFPLCTWHWEWPALQLLAVQQYQHQWPATDYPPLTTNPQQQHHRPSSSSCSEYQLVPSRNPALLLLHLLLVKLPAVAKESFLGRFPLPSRNRVLLGLHRELEFFPSLATAVLNVSWVAYNSNSIQSDGDMPLLWLLLELLSILPWLHQVCTGGCNDLQVSKALLFGLGADYNQSLAHEQLKPSKYLKWYAFLRLFSRFLPNRTLT